MSFDIEATRARLIAGADAVVAAKDRLTEADRDIGDGDHGLGMARGFTAAAEALKAKDAATIGDLFKAAGMAIMGKAGGASGAVFGSFFIGAAKPLTGDTLSAADLAAALEAGLAAVTARGGAGPGDKTVIDALVPAIERARAAGDDAAAAARAAAEGAAAGVEATKEMVARTGKARSLGERSLGYIDPGALSFATFSAAFAEPPAA